MKKIALSLMTIATVMVVAVGATSAYFSDARIIGNNTFSTGTVTLGNVNDMSVQVNGLIPGQTQTRNVGFAYTGSTGADIYIGNRGAAGGPNFYLANKLYVQIFDKDGNEVFYGTADKLATNWTRLVNNGGNGWYSFEVRFTLSTDVGNSFQNQSNVITEFLLYAVQNDGPIPTIRPYCVSGSSGNPDTWSSVGLPPACLLP